MPEFGGLWKHKHTQQEPKHQNNQHDNCGDLMEEEENAQHNLSAKLQATVSRMLSSTTAIFGYTISLSKTVS